MCSVYYYKKKFILLDLLYKNILFMYFMITLSLKKSILCVVCVLLTKFIMN